MNLAIDIGNTAVKFGLFNGLQMLETHTGVNVIHAIFRKHKIEKIILSKTGDQPQIEAFLEKNGKPVARIVPTASKPERGREVAAALRKAVEDVHPGEVEATSWLHDLEQSRSAMAPHGKPWRF